MKDSTQFSSTPPRHKDVHNNIFAICLGSWTKILRQIAMYVNVAIENLLYPTFVISSD